MPIINDVEYIEVFVSDVRGASNSMEALSLILTDNANRERHMPIIIGIVESRAILAELHNKLPFRPLTHTLFADLFTFFLTNYDLEFVSIDKFEDGIFYASIVIKYPDGTFTSIDARPSDAVAIALHCGIPIFVNKELFDKKHIIASQPKETFEDSDIEQDTEENLNLVPTEILENMLKDAIDEENYEYAARLQEELNKRKK